MVRETRGIELTSIAGGGFSTSLGEIPATLAAIAPTSVAIDASGTLYFTDLLNNRVAKLTSAGTIFTVAGNGMDDSSGDGGLATQAALKSPFSIAIDASGNLLIADNSAATVRRVNPDGIISKVAGNKLFGFSGDGGPAVTGTFNIPQSIAFGPSGSLYVADFLNNRIRRIDASGLLSTVAGSGRSGKAGDGGPATSADLYLPAGVAVDGSGNVMRPIPLLA